MTGKFGQLAAIDAEFDVRGRAKDMFADNRAKGGTIGIIGGDLMKFAEAAESGSMWKHGYKGQVNMVKNTMANAKFALSGQAKKVEQLKLKKQKVLEMKRKVAKMKAAQSR